MQTKQLDTSSTLDPEEISRFGAMADEWWDPKGKFRPLHKISPARLGFFREQICGFYNRDQKETNALAGLTLLDIGCGGGLVAEPMAKQGAKVTAIDPSENNIEAAKVHAERNQIDIDYRCCIAEDLVANNETFDIVMVLEVVEHVPSVSDFVNLVSKLVAPSGFMIMSTINRTMKSYALAIVGTEYILQWLPKGTHQWNRFVKPEELKLFLSQAAMQPRELSGLSYNPLRDDWSITGDTDVNYFLTASRK